MFTVDPGLFPMVLSPPWLTHLFHELSMLPGEKNCACGGVQVLQLQVAKNSGEAKGVGDMS